jgi:hypothetical protein
VSFDYLRKRRTTPLPSPRAAKVSIAISPPPLLVPLPLFEPLPAEPLALVVDPEDPLPEVPLPEVSPLVEPVVEPLPLEPEPLLLLPMLPLEPVLLPDWPLLLPLWSLPEADPVVPPVWPLVEPVLEPLWPLMEPVDPVLEPLCGVVELVLDPLWSFPVVEPLVDEPLVCANRTVTPTISTAIINSKTFFICSPSGSRPVFLISGPRIACATNAARFLKTEEASAVDRFEGKGEGCPPTSRKVGARCVKKSGRFCNCLRRVVGPQLCAGDQNLYPKLPVPQQNCAARNRFSVSAATVTGPTPPGTGVIFEALSTTLRKSTSPTSFPAAVTRVAISNTTTPGFSIAASIL